VDKKRAGYRRTNTVTGCGDRVKIETLLPIR
jgi:hypothetical protein